jgi:GT2 family glycosyltransferase
MNFSRLRIDSPMQHFSVRKTYISVVNYIYLICPNSLRGFLKKVLPRNKAFVMVRILAWILTPFILVFQIVIGIVVKRLIFVKDSRADLQVIRTTSSISPRRKSTEVTYVVLGSIDWNFRFQRPQQLTTNIKSLGIRSIYINPTLEVLSDLYQVALERGNVEVVTLGSLDFRRYIPLSNFEYNHEIHYAKMLEGVLQDIGVNSRVFLVESPDWYPLIKHFPGDAIYYDCIDSHADFRESNLNSSFNEKRVLELSEKIFATSVELSESLETKSKVFYVPNGVESSHFQKVFLNSKRNEHEVFTCGYFGAIAEWFDAELIYKIATDLPHVQFELIGNVTDVNVKIILKGLKNIRFLGEIPYSELPVYIRHWRVGLIPFKLTPLIMNTNPVKMYEYAAAGLPTFASQVPEVVRQSRTESFIKTFDRSSSWVEAIRELMDSPLTDSAPLQEWASTNEWKSRAREILKVEPALPLFSIIILMWNKAALTINCLNSIMETNDYANYEIVLVDNNSENTEKHIIREWLDKNKNHIKIKYVENKENFGFAGGNNIGIRNSRGEYLVILNNDTEVLHGFIRRGLRHFQRNPKLGLLGVSTDNIGNEGRVFGSEASWRKFATNVYGFLPTQSFENGTVAFFCVFVKRSIVEEIGELNEDFGVGGFEDDDYCRRVQLAGGDIHIARDIFVHHELSATFDLLSDDFRNKNFDKNKILYESMWGKWNPHKYSTDEFQ